MSDRGSNAHSFTLHVPVAVLKKHSNEKQCFSYIAIEEYAKLGKGLGSEGWLPSVQSSAKVYEYLNKVPWVESMYIPAGDTL